MGKTFYVFDSEVLSGSLSTFEKSIPWDMINLSGNHNTIAVTYVSGLGQINIKEVELLLDTSVTSNNSGGFGDLAAESA